MAKLRNITNTKRKKTYPKSVIYKSLFASSFILNLLQAMYIYLK